MAVGDYRLVEVRVRRLGRHSYAATAVLEDQCLDDDVAYRGLDLDVGPYYGRTYRRAWRKAWRDNGSELVPRLAVNCACGAGCTDGVCTVQELGE